LAQENYIASNNTVTVIAPPPKPAPYSPFATRNTTSGQPSPRIKKVIVVDDDVSEYQPSEDDDDIVEIRKPVHANSSIALNSSLFNDNDIDLGRGNLVHLVDSLFTEGDADVGRRDTIAGGPTDNPIADDDEVELEESGAPDEEADPDGNDVDEEERERRQAQRQ
jgi:hypothetical protein